MAFFVESTERNPEQVSAIQALSKMPNALNQLNDCFQEKGDRVQLDGPMVTTLMTLQLRTVQSESICIHQRVRLVSADIGNWVQCIFTLSGMNGGENVLMIGVVDCTTVDAAGWTTFLTMPTGVLFLFAFIFQWWEQTKLWVFIVPMIVLWVSYAMWPGKRFLSTRSYLMRSFSRQIRAPFTTVRFVDFFIADQWCSLFTVIVDLVFTACFFVNWEFTENGTTTDYTKGSKCVNRTSKMYIKLLRFFPFWIRFAQCIKRYHDTRNRHHLVNAGKYSTAIITSIVSTLDETINAHGFAQENIVLSTLRLCFALISTIYAFGWDIVMDWGLLQPDSAHWGLRTELRFKPIMYYMAVLVNLLFRVSWMIYLFPFTFGLDAVENMHYIGLGLGAVEITRRCIWNIFRLENEHLNNCGQFRVVRDIPPLVPTVEQIMEEHAQEDAEESAESAEEDGSVHQEDSGGHHDGKDNQATDSPMFAMNLQEEV